MPSFDNPENRNRVRKNYSPKIRSQILAYFLEGEESTPITTSDVLADESKNSNNGTFNNFEAADIVESSPGGTSKYSVSFGGTNEHIDLGNATELSFDQDDPFTISFWANWTDAHPAAGMFVSKMAGSSPFRGYFIAASVNGVINAALRNSAAPGANSVNVVTIQNGFNDGEWHHIAWTYDGLQDANTTNIYVDDQDEPLTILTDNLSATTITSEPVRFGARGSGGTSSPYTGLMDDIGIYNKCLSAAEVSEIYNKGKPTDLRVLSTKDNLVGYWLMGDRKAPDEFNRERFRRIYPYKRTRTRLG